MDEPSVLDYLKSRLMPWRSARVVLPPAPLPGEAEMRAVSATDEAMHAPAHRTAEKTVSTLALLPWSSLLALGFSLAAQVTLEPPEPSPGMGLVLYALALVFLGLALRRAEWKLAALPPELVSADEPLSVRRVELFTGGALAVLAFLTLRDNRFTPLNVTLWLGSLVLLLRAFWVSQPNPVPWWQRLRAFLAPRRWTLVVTPFMLLFVAVLILGVFFRFYRLADVPPEMVSDHAEKLLDVYDVGHGEPRIFFPRNTGREFFQMYLTAAVIQVFGTGYSFLSLKIGTALAGFLTLPFIYLFGKEVASKRVGLLAMAFAGMAYWPNVISRAALRFTLYPFFAAPLMYFLVRGLRRRSRNDFILAGLFLGLGLHGYSPYRIVPFLVVRAVVLYLIHRQSTSAKRAAIYGLLLIALISLVVFLPLLRFMLENPDLVNYRALTRVGSLERPLPGSPLVIFFQNLYRSLLMFGWNNGSIWVHSVSGRPAFDVAAASLFHLGVVLVLLRYIRRRHWLDAFLLISIPVLMLPSILSLAFPDENPSLNRSAAALIPAVVLVGIALDGLMRSITAKLPRLHGELSAWAVAVVLLVWSGVQNYALVFDEYARVYRQSAWNTSEMGAVLQDFDRSFGDLDHAWVVAFPYWVDTRLVGIIAGDPLRDTAIWPEQIAQIPDDGQAKIFLVNPSDTAGLGALRTTYPDGTLKRYTSATPTKDFMVFFVAGAATELIAP